ncbi:MAG: type II secretion system F family protein [Parasporobacterium sp.]|nr:type II secretion system F family protein [Parasporobacterium sp.]
MDMAQMLSSNLLAGYSLENAMEKTCRQLKESNKDMGDLYTMLVRMLRQISMGESTEDVWLDFSRQIPIEEIQVFGQIFGLSKRSGASLPDVLQKVVRQLCLKIQTEAQIQTVIAGKRAEQKVMNFMPSGILVYISITSSDMMKVMYESLIGRLIMTICLGVYILAYCLSEKMLRNYL